MSELAILEEYYLHLLRTNQKLDLNKILMNIESSIHDLDGRLSKVGAALQDLLVKFTKNMFISVYQVLRDTGSWVKIGASVKNTKPNSVEGYLKSHFFGGDMDAQMTASWVSAILVRSNVGIIFNDKAVGQAIRYEG